MRMIFTGFVAFFVAVVPAWAAGDPSLLIISMDGLRPDLIFRADAPMLRALIRDSSFTMYARTTDLAITLPSHVSMITGVTPERHGTTFNDAEAPPMPIYPKVPTIFEIAKKRGVSTALIAGKEKFLQLVPPEFIDWSSIPPDRTISDAEVAVNAVKIIHDHHPRLVFVHLPDVDSAGHRYGWGSNEQLVAVAKTDRAVQAIYSAFKTAVSASRAYTILSADHGGAKKRHGAGDPLSAFIPLIIIGPDIPKNSDLSLINDNIRIEDIFTTACRFLKLDPPQDLDGRLLKFE